MDHTYIHISSTVPSPEGLHPIPEVTKVNAVRTFKYSFGCKECDRRKCNETQDQGTTNPEETPQTCSSNVKFQWLSHQTQWYHCVWWLSHWNLTLELQVWGVSSGLVVPWSWVSLHFRRSHSLHPKLYLKVLTALTLVTSGIGWSPSGLGTVLLMCI